MSVTELESDDKSPFHSSAISADGLVDEDFEEELGRPTIVSTNHQSQPTIVSTNHQSQPTIVSTNHQSQPTIVSTNHQSEIHCRQFQNIEVFEKKSEILQ